MHQLRFRLGLRPKPRWGAYSAPPDPLAGFKDLRGRFATGRGRGKEIETDREGREEKGRREGREREGMEKGRGKVTEGMVGMGQDMR